MTVAAELLGVLIAVLTVGFAMAGLALAEIRALRADMREQRAEILAWLDAIEMCVCRSAACGRSPGTSFSDARPLRPRPPTASRSEQS